MGHPGTLPTINREAVRKVLLVGRAVGGELATYTEFDRKHYFYPDIPKGYQISQYAYPLVRGGLLADVAITRIHLEEDTARSLHDRGEYSLVDYNRAGVPLMELVTEPVIHDAATAGAFARELQLLLRSLSVSEANMERGEMRVEVNISIAPEGERGTKVEVKNLNSFKSVEAAIAHEIQRQTTLLESGQEVSQETRGWDELRGETVAQRKKESSHDYRYFPDPDLPKLDLSTIEEFSISRLDEMMSEIPSKRRLQLAELGLPSGTIEQLVTNIEAGRFYDAALAALIEIRGKVTDDERKKLANYLTSDLLGHLTDHEGKTLADAFPRRLAELVHMLASGAIHSRAAKDLLPDVVLGDASPEVLAAERGLLGDGATEGLAAAVDAVLAEHAAVAEEYRAGKEAALQFLIGQCMRATRGAADPAAISTLLKERLS